MKRGIGWVAILILCSAVVDAAMSEAEKFSLEDITSRYYTNEELAEFIEDFTSSEKCSKISRRFSIGQSVLGTELWVLEISDQPGIPEPEPNFKYVANMHGDEPGGRQLLPGLARWLCDNYMIHPAASRIVNDMHLFLMPTMNPDGYKLGQRYNANNKDLNRNFPDRTRDVLPLKPSGFEEPETLAVINWVQNGSFVASANMHEGALVANYPWDAKSDGSPGYAASPDDKTFVYLSLVYSKSHGEMYKSKEFKHGITNGNDWYPVYGGMQDWNYVAANCMEITLELSPKKHPSAATLPKQFEDNLPAMVNYALESAFGGISGYVSSKKTGAPLVAAISVEGIDRNIYSGPLFGDFHRSLAPGTYLITVSADGYVPEERTVKVPQKLGVGLSLYFQLDTKAQGAAAAATMKVEKREKGKNKGSSCGFWCLWGVLRFLT